MKVIPTNRNKVLILSGILILVCFLWIGFFALPVALPVCGLIGLSYGIKHKDKRFANYSAAVLTFGIICVVYTLIVIKYM